MPTILRILDPETWILTVDDDVRHLPNAIENLEAAAIADPNVAYGYSDYALWRKKESAGKVDFLAGYGGCLYRRGFFAEDFLPYFNKAISRTSCLFQDDIVISNYLYLKDIPRQRLALPNCNIKLMKSRGCMLEHAGGADALSHGAGSGMRTKERSLDAINFLRKNKFFYGSRVSVR